MIHVEYIKGNGEILLRLTRRKCQYILNSILNKIKYVGNSSETVEKHFSISIWFFVDIIDVVSMAICVISSE